ncbi:hypothetical protein NKH78_20745 [Mesorhizobium sp. M0910]
MNPRTRQTLEFILDNLVWFMLVFVLVVFSILIPNYFQLGIFANIIEASSVLGVMSIGLALSSSPAIWTCLSNRWRRSAPWRSAFCSARRASALASSCSRNG